MGSVMVDTSVWIDYSKSKKTVQTDMLDQLLLAGKAITGDLIVAEFFQGFRTDAEYKKNKSLIDSLKCFDLAGKDIAVHAAEHYRFLRNKGITIRSTIDMIISTFCINHDLILLHDDHDYDPIEQYLGLQVAR